MWLILAALALGGVVCCEASVSTGFGAGSARYLVPPFVLCGLTVAVQRLVRSTGTCLAAVDGRYRRRGAGSLAVGRVSETKAARRPIDFIGATDAIAASIHAITDAIEGIYGGPS